jgi:hypothetical protein
LELELTKSRFTAKWCELDSKPNRKLPALIGHYSKDFYQHPEHRVILSLLLRAHLFPAFLAGSYEEQITIGVDLLNAIDEYRK